MNIPRTKITDSFTTRPRIFPHHQNFNQITKVALMFAAFDYDFKILQNKVIIKVMNKSLRGKMESLKIAE